jgi:hypothetical protein
VLPIRLDSNRSWRRPPARPHGSTVLENLTESQYTTGHASASCLSAFKYHAPLAQPGEDGAPLFAPPHVDGGLLSVIFTTQPGLQVSCSHRLPTT